MCQINSLIHRVTEFNSIFHLWRNIFVKKKNLISTDRTYLDILFACLQSTEYLKLANCILVYCEFCEMRFSP